MNIELYDSAPQPRANVKIERLDVTPHPDGWRVKLNIEVTPFQERPSLEIRVSTAAGRLVSELTVIETMHARMEFTVHLRGLQSPIGEYVAQVDLYYDDRGSPLHRAEKPFTIQQQQ